MLYHTRVRESHVYVCASILTLLCHVHVTNNNDEINLISIILIMHDGVFNMSQIYSIKTHNKQQGSLICKLMNCTILLRVCIFAKIYDCYTYTQYSIVRCIWVVFLHRTSVENNTTPVLYYA